jgi:WD40 repeat protein
MHGGPYRLGTVFVFALAVHAASGAEPAVGERAPVLRVEAGGPTARVTGMAFSPDGKTLYVAGLDKVVRVWTRDAKDERFEPTSAYRVPLGPGVQGALNAVAVSPDGEWLATAGSAAVRMTSGFREPGLVWLPSREALSPDMWQDLGTIYLFNTHDGTVRLLRGHGGSVWTLAFVQGARAPRLVSAAWAYNAGTRLDVRLWDVDANPPKLVATAPARRLPTTKEGYAVGVAAWAVGDKPEQTRVAIAAGDGKLRVWSAAGNSIAEGEDTEKNAALTYLVDRKQILSSSPTWDTGAWRANFRIWDSTGDAPVLRRENTQGGGASLYWPLALAAVPAGAGGKIAYVAAVCRVHENARQEYRLCLVDPDKASIVHQRALWSAGPLDAQPVLAVGPRGRHVAVAGRADHAVAVFAIEDLIDKKQEPQLQQLQGVGATVRRIAWVSKKGEPGLALRRANTALDADHGPGTVDGDLLFEFGKAPRLTTDTAGWNLAPRTALSNVELTAWSERLKIPNLTAGALLPAGTLLKERRLLAVASFVNGEPALALYDAQTAQQVRELTGHIGVISSLAFSKDGTRLASCADDQTVAVWDLADLPRVMGRSGTLRGVFVVDRPGGKGLLVVRVEAGSSAVDKLRSGQVVEGWLENGKLRRFESAREFYVALSEHQPGEKVTLRLGNGKDTTLTLDPTIDERKPLLSLFVTRDRDWIGWSPKGPYESSGLKVEGYIGWHVGTGNPERPVAFAVAKEYKEYRKDGALRELLDTGEVAPPAPPAPPKPRMTLWIGERDGAPSPRDAQGRFVLPRRTAKLHLQVEEFPLDLVKDVTWQLDGGKVERFPASKDSDWSADLAKMLDDSRAPHVVRAELRTKGDDPRQYPAEITFRYQPPPPTLKLVEAGGKKPEGTGGILRFDSKTPDYSLKFEASPGAADEKVEVQLTHGNRSKEVGGQKWNLDKRTTLDHQLKLVSGLNAVEVVARNAGAPAGASAESTKLLLQVDFQPEPVRISLREVVPLPAGESQRLDGTRGDAVTVNAKRVRVIGVVETKGMPMAEWRRGKEKPSALRLDEANKFELELELNPGAEDLSFTASTPGTKADAVPLKIRFEPVPPTVVLNEPEPVYEGEHAGHLTVRGTIRPPTGSAGFAYSTTVRVDGKLLKAATAAINEEKRTVEIKLPVEPGAAYRVEAELTNAWGKSTRSNAALARYWSPPTKIDFNPVAKVVKTPLLDLRASIRSRSPVTKAEASVQNEAGDEYPLRDLPIKATSARPDTYEVSLQKVPMAKGKNTVRLWAANEQGRSRQPGEIVVQYQEPADPPVVRVLGPAEEKVHARDYELKFQVTSKAPLQLVDVVNGKKTYGKGREWSKLPKNAQGLYESKEAVTIPLQPGMNRLEIVAVNEGGAGRAAVAVSFVVIPVRLELDALSSSDGKRVELRRFADGVVTAEKVPDARLGIRGRIVWDDASDPFLKSADQWVRVYVNGFQQQPAELQPAEGKTERTFETEILLNRSVDNRVEFELPGLKWSAQSRPQVKVLQCGKFHPQQWLHLLVIGAGEEDDKQLLEGVLKAVGAKGEPKRLYTDVFQHVELYGPLTAADDILTPDTVKMQLVQIRETIHARGAAGAGDIVLVYFRGGELVDDKGHFLLTGPRARAGTTLPSADLARFFARNRGAQLLFLDVVRDAGRAGGTDQIQQEWRHDPQVARVGVFRSALRSNDPRPPVGEAARLDKALQEEMPKAAFLGDVEAGLRLKYEKLGNKFPAEIGQLPYFYVHPRLENVLVHQKTDK